ncbi:MAG: hypothetical protein WCQ96_00100 [Patescibacteria group bacterium]
MQEKESIIKVFLRRTVILNKFLFSGIKITALNPYWRKREIAQTLFLSAIINLSMWVYLYANRIESDYPVILHYNLFFGVDFLGDYGMVFLLPTVGAIIFLLNALLGQFFYKIERLASYILTLNILIVQAFLMLACYLIIRTNV